MNEKLRNEELSKAKGEETSTCSAINQTNSIKEKLQRASYLGARFVYAKDEEGTVIPEQSFWAVHATDAPQAEFTEENSILTVSASEAYGNDLHRVAKDDTGSDDPEGRTNWQFMASKAYGNELVAFIKDAGIDTVFATFKVAEDPALAAGLEAPPESEPISGTDPLAEPEAPISPELPGEEGSEEDKDKVTTSEEAGEALEKAKESRRPLR